MNNVVRSKDEQCITSWCNNNFFTVFPPKNTNFNNYPQMREPLWESRSLAQKYQHTVGARKSKIGCIEEGKRNSFTLPMSCFPQGSVAHYQRRCSDNLWLVIPPTGESKSMWMKVWFPQLWETLPKRSTSHPIQIAEVYCVAEGGSVWEGSR